MRILVTGAAGTGTTTLGRALAREVGAKFIDADDHFWLPSEPPYQTKREPPARLESILQVLRTETKTVVAGSVVGWGAELEQGFSVIVFLSVPTAVRLARLKQREIERFGRCDEAFLEWAGQYDEGRLPGRSRRIHENWLDTRDCPKLRIEGDVPVGEQVARVLQAIPEWSVL